MLSDALWPSLDSRCHVADNTGYVVFMQAEIPLLSIPGAFDLARRNKPLSIPAICQRMTCRSSHRKFYGARRLWLEPVDLLKELFELLLQLLILCSLIEFADEMATSS